MLFSRFSHPYQYELDHLVMPESLKCKPDAQVNVVFIICVLLRNCDCFHLDLTSIIVFLCGLDVYTYC